MNGVLPLQIVTALTMFGASGCAGRVEQRTDHASDGKSAFRTAVLAVLLRGDANAWKKLDRSITDCPGIVSSVRVIRDKRGRIVRYENADGIEAPVSARELSDSRAIEVRAVDCVPSQGAKPAKR
jgi:hypothetical protein